MSKIPIQKVITAEDFGTVQPESIRLGDNWTPGLGKGPQSQCGSCMYYLNKRCRRHAPKGQEGWSAVYPTDWCGDHKLPKESM